MVQTRLATAYRSRASIRGRQSKYFPQIYAVFQRTAPLLPDICKILPRVFYAPAERDPLEFCDGADAQKLD